MDEHYAAWQKSSHHAVATCNGRHTPPGGLAGEYYVKAKNEFAHSFYFTTGEFPYPLRITEPNHEVVERACRSGTGRTRTWPGPETDAARRPTA